MRALTSAIVGAVRRPAALIAAPLVALLAGTGIWLAAPPTAGAATSDLTFNGRGYGHGRGMSQWGAYGYAVDYGSSYQGILDHYYGGTTLAGDAGNPAVSVELMAQQSKETVLTGSGLTVNGSALGRGAMLVRGVARNTFDVYVGDTCAGPWTPWAGPSGARVVGQASVTGGISLCDAGQAKPYRGNMVILDGGPANLAQPGFQTTVNVVAVDDYLRGVVPREMSAGWGSAGGGRGMEALKVQAVAARSYALSSQWASYAKTCDTTACQVYGGASGEDSRSDTAVAQTSGQVRRKPGGAIARTEFSASSGGWTAGGDFPAVEDLGDATSPNTSHTWSVTFSRATVAARLGIPDIYEVRVTQRNGLGADGGRALQVVFDTSSGQKTFTGNQVRIALGLKSDWWTIGTVSTASARSFARALYVDVLGREGDSPSVETWTGTLAAGVPRYSVAMAFTGSGERYGQWVRSVYSTALLRPAEPSAVTYWSNYLANGATLNQLNAGVYGSPESVARLGGGDVRLWVEAVYQNLLGRSASEGDRSVWQSRASQYGLQSVAWAISQSAEACNRRLDAYYRALLGRPADSGGLNNWGPLLAGNGDVTVVAAIAASEEYANRADARFPS